MRLSAIQKDVLFVLYAIERRGQAAPVPAVRLLAMINSTRSDPVYASNFRASCHTLVGHGLLEKYRAPSLKLAFKLTTAGGVLARGIYRQRQEVLAEQEE